MENRRGHSPTLVRSIAMMVVLVGLAFAASADAGRYEVRPGREDQEVRFLSKAPVESFEGTTDQVSGWIEVSPDSLVHGVRWHVEVDLTELDTGIGLRNRHMRENHLHTDQFPHAVFEGAMEGAGLPAAIPTVDPIALEGTFTLHGVARVRTIDTLVTRRPDGALEILAEFVVRLGEHDIPRPKFLMMKLSEEQRIRVRLVADPVAEESR